MLNIVIPMAGRGSRFAVAGYELPKPLIPVLGIPMIQLVIANLRPQRPHRFIFLCQEEHLRQHDLASKLATWAPACQIIGVDGVTEGAACTVLLCREKIDNDDALMIANCDQWIDVTIEDYLRAMDEADADGWIMTMTADDPKWSFVRLTAGYKVTEVVEKQVISNEATVGIYNFRRGRDFVRAAKQMIDAGLRVNNEFYVAPTYNQLISEGQNIGIYNIGSDLEGMYGLGIPADLERFVTLPVASRAVAACT